MERFCICLEERNQEQWGGYAPFATRAPRILSLSRYEPLHMTWVGWWEGSAEAGPKNSSLEKTHGVPDWVDSPVQHTFDLGQSFGSGFSRKATIGRELMAPRTDRTTCIPSGVASPVTANHAAKGSVFVYLRNGGNIKRRTVFPSGSMRPFSKPSICRVLVSMFGVHGAGCR